MLFGQEHVDRYVATDGEEGFAWHKGTEILILTTTGRKSGQSRSNALIFGRHGDDYLVVGSKGGAPKPPAWYVNLSANPEVQVQVKGELWKIMTAAWPDYDQYQERTDREIPVVILTRD
jgi:hypothetical protein